MFPYYPVFRVFSFSNLPLLCAKDTSDAVLLTIPTQCDTIPLFRGSTALPQEDIRFLKEKGALDLPPRDLVDQFVSSYFHIFHPFSPIVDKLAFLQQYHQSDQACILSSRGPSLLLLQAVIFTASSVS
ncbi:hypothetical protein F4810DRAFT_409721 [Camillea tinctor]|nr:hypothetical protein F4810DRAFT_409721 [Camillea tinctor]